jgi:hypothetical protein
MGNDPALAELDMMPAPLRFTVSLSTVPAARSAAASRDLIPAGPGPVGLWRATAACCAAVTAACGTGLTDPEHPTAPANANAMTVTADNE